MNYAYFHPILHLCGVFLFLVNVSNHNLKSLSYKLNVRPSSDSLLFSLLYGLWAILLVISYLFKYWMVEMNLLLLFVIVAGIVTFL